MLLWARQAVRRPDTIINLAGHAWASLGARGPARHDPLTNPGRHGPNLCRAGMAHPFGHL
jgi:hypothetical protein